MQIARRSPVALERLGAALILDHPKLARVARRLIPPLNTALDYRGWPISVLSEDASPQARWQALETGPYGRCVYRCDNDVVDHQIVTMEFESGASAAMVMHGHSHREGRTMRYDGTRATVRGQYYPDEQEIQVHDHRTGRVDVIRPTVGPIGATGHGGGDVGLMAAFVRAVRDRAQALTTGRESLESHLMAFAAEEARVNRSVLTMEEFRRRSETAAR